MKQTAVFVVIPLIIFVILILSSAYASAYVKVYKDVKDKIDAEGYADVIILMDKDDDKSVAVNTLGHTSEQASRRNMNAKRLSDLSDIDGFEKSKHLASLNGYSGKLTREGLEDLTNKGFDVTIYENTIFYVLDEIETSSSLVLSTPLNVSTAAIHANYSWNVLNITGRNITVAVIDTGIDYNHSDLGGCFGNGTNASCKIFGGYDFVSNENDPMDDFGHGTHVAGILSADGNITGVAPDAIIYALKACDSGGSCSTDNIALAIEWAKNASVSVVSISLGLWVGNVTEGNSGKNVLSQEISTLTDANITVVIAAGNSGPGVSSILAPADAESAITVGAVDDNNTVTVLDDAVWYESSRGPSLVGRLDPELVAPGYYILSARLGGGYEAEVGTSMAAPFVSGAVALLLEQYSPSSLTPLQVRAILLQSTSGVDGKVFAKGAGELNLQNALTGRLYALINQTDSYNRNVLNDRWEFVTLPSTISRANITIFNDNDYNISFGTIIEDIISMENNNFQLNKSQLGVPESIVVGNNSVYTFEINFTLTNFSSVYATTYGGIIFFNGSGYNGTENVTKSLRVPVVITVPVTASSYLQRTIYTMDHNGYIIQNFPHDDIYSYCYYNALPRNLSININWSNLSRDLDLYLYDSDGIIDTFSGNGWTESEAVMTANTDIFKWFRIDGFTSVSVPFTFDINLTSLGNTLPTIINITDGDGINNGTLSAPSLIFYRPENITLNISYYDADNDTVNITINDSEFVLVNDSFNLSTGMGYALFEKLYNYTIPRNSTVSTTLTDLYGGIITRNINVLMYSSILILEYVPSSSSYYIKQNNSINFTLDITEINNNTLYYYWNLNGSINSTDNAQPNYTFDSTGLSPGNYTVDVLISNNDTTNNTNETVSWMIYVDAQSPTITVQSPEEEIYTYSHIDINYTVSDASSGISRCWLLLNSTSEIFGGANYSYTANLNSCANTSAHLANGNYVIRIYSNDSVDNIGYSEINFSVNDTTSPVILSTSPSGTVAYTSSVTLSLTTDENSTCKYGSDDSNYSSMAYSFSNSVTSHTAVRSVSPGLNLFYTRCMDMSNNTNNVSGNISFTVESAPPPDEGDGGSTGGDTGGSSGGVYYTPNADRSVTGIIYEYDEGENDVFLEDDEIPINHISITMNGSGNNSVFTVTKTLNPEHNYSEVVYAYLKIDAENFNFEQLQAAKIFFSIESNWLILNNISRENVVLLRYDDISGNWTTLLTELLNESYNNTYYVAHTPGFGLFAVSHNASRSEGNAPVNMTLNETKKIMDNQSNNPSVLSGNQASGGKGTLSQLANSVAERVRTLSLEWIVVILFGVFVAVIGVELTLRKESMAKYKEDIISGTHKEFPKTDNVLLNDVVSSSNIFLKASDINKSTRQQIPEDATVNYQKLKEIAHGKKK